MVSLLKSYKQVVADRRVEDVGENDENNEQAKTPPQLNTAQISDVLVVMERTVEVTWK